jgi:hypothetical protein
MPQNTGVNEWDDPYQIIDVDEMEELSDDRKRAILEAVSTAYEDQHTTTRLDANASFRLENLTSIADTSDVEYEFEVHRFIGGTPAERYTGHVHRTEDGWEATFTNQSQGNGFLDSLRALLPHTSPN